MPSRAASTSSVAEPVHRTGRECGVSPRSAPKRHDDLAARLVCDREHVVAERAPRRLGSDAEQEHEVAAVRNPSAENVSAGQFTVAQDTVDEFDRRARRLEIEVLLGIQRGARNRPERARQPPHRVGRGIARVVPAAERGDQCGPFASVGRGIPADGHVTHPMLLAANHRVAHDRVS